MTAKHPICVVTGSRADYGLLYWVMKEIQNSATLSLRVAVTGMHLCHEYGMTVDRIVEDGFPIHARIDNVLAGDTACAVGKSTGLGVIGFADYFERERPDLLLFLGDRHEILAAATAAMIARIPMAHFCGGDISEGAYDESIRHCLTKMSHLHFTSNRQSADRVIAMGENPENVFVVGSPGLDYIRQAKLPDRQQLEQELAFGFRERNLLITFHPETLGTKSSTDSFKELLEALEALGPEVGLLFTRTNSDNDGRALNAMLDNFLQNHPQAKAWTSMGSHRYLALMSSVDAVVGNSSSGLYEAPSFGTPTVDIGERQAGRLAATSVIRCSAERSSILQAIREAFLRGRQPTVNPYGDGTASRQTRSILESVLPKGIPLQKRFHSPSQ
ncbi:UDP-N-acetylglucosamine 2-epimerase [Kamptonema cortianum]|nr:UDP-N-acetylglucosamine 2-epimerase [Kamptonema cortianum]MDL5046130.1 UDP-N-acetylglucosamine 2-epimerase [Oscillatoria amoena NRMC-F 0135]